MAPGKTAPGMIALAIAAPVASTVAAGMAGQPGVGASSSILARTLFMTSLEALAGILALIFSTSLVISWPPVVLGEGEGALTSLFYVLKASS